MATQNESRGHSHTRSSNSAEGALSSGHNSLYSSFSAPFHPPPPIPSHADRLLPIESRDGAPRKKQKTIKSQYPSDGTERHVEYILVASFDIDRGSIMEHQYPGPVGGDEHMLAELMLPDQTHMRSQDWTIFFLHKDAVAEEQYVEGRDGRKRRKRRWRREDGRNGQAVGGADTGDEGVWKDEENGYDEESSDEDDELVDGPPLVYVLNLVNTKQDNTVKRGAIVKAMAICTRHSFLHIYKPLLLLALEQYFANPVVETLASLYDAVNSMDLSLMPRLNSYERFILQSAETKDLFVEKFEAVIAQRMAARDTDATDGFQPAPSPGLQHLARNRYGLPRDTHELETVVRYANVPVPIKVPTALSAETVGDFSIIKLITTFSNPHATAPVAFNPTHPHLTTSGSTTHPIIVLLNALLTQKRIIFLGHNLPSSEVAEAVLGACALASGGLLRGFTRHAFPYTDLTKIDDLLKVPGFIAGVTNPAFAHKTEWWDLLCDLPTGRMRISNRIEQAPLTEGVVFFQQPGNTPTISASGAGISAIAAAGASLSAGLGGSAATTGVMGGDATGDQAFIANTLAAINERHGENAIRSKFRRWILKFTRLAAAFEETVYGASALQIQASPKVGFDSPSVGTQSPSGAKPLGAEAEMPPEVTGHGYVWSTPQAKINELAANATRIDGWRNTRSYYNFIQDLAAHYHHRPVKNLDLQHLHDKLAKLRLSPSESGEIYLALCAAAHTEKEVCQFLAVVANGVWSHDQKGGAGVGAQSGQPGLFFIAMGLFHPRMEVREQVMELLERVREHEAGRHFWDSMGRFARIRWERVKAGKAARVSEHEDG